MGIYDQLENLNKASPSPKAPVAAPDTSKTAPNDESGQSPPLSNKNQPSKSPTLPEAKPNEAATVRPAVRLSDHKGVRAETRPTARPRKRVTLRYAFEFYRDQIEIFRRLSLQTKLEGDDLSMSEMAREAFDDYITRKGLRAYERTN